MRFFRSPLGMLTIGILIGASTSGIIHGLPVLNRLPNK